MSQKVNIIAGAVAGVLFIVCIILGFSIYKEIDTPIKIRKDIRENRDATIERLLYIKEAQLGFRELKGKFAKSWDELEKAYKTEKFPVIKVIGDESLLEIDSTIVIERDTTYVSMTSQFFPNHQEGFIDSLRYIPNTNRTEEFALSAGETRENKIKVQVFEVTAQPEQYLKETIEKYELEPEDLFNELRNFSSEGPPYLVLGSLDRANYNGNWQEVIKINP